MFPFCSHQEAGSRLAGLRVLAADTQGRNSSPRWQHPGDGEVPPVPDYLVGTKMTVMGVVRIARAVLMLATTRVI